jgi:predicted NUDIX family phosphoesterase
LQRDKKRTIKELERLAAEVLILKQEREQRRPLLIEFCGSPKSGKSTTITSLNLFLKRNGFKTVVLTERASICPIGNKTHPFFNIWTMSSAVAEIVMHLDMGVGNVDIIISDRGIFDALCWFEWLNKNPNDKSKYFDNKAYEEIQKFIFMDIWHDYLDLIYIFTVEPETSIKREYSNLLTEKRGTIMTEPVLTGFNNAVKNVTEKFGEKFRNIQLIKTDTPETNEDPNEVGYLVTSEILRSLKDLLIEKIGYFEAKIIPKLKPGINSVSIIKHSTLQFENRDKVEKSNTLQPIAIAVITNKRRNKLLVVKKGLKRTPTNSPEHDKLLVYIGGHIRIEDLRSTTLLTIEQTLHREIQEEIGESLTIQNSNPFLIYSPDSEKSRKHLAVCFIIEMDLDEKKFKLVTDEFVRKTGTSKSGHVLKISEITSGKNRLENWSRHILNHAFKTKLKLVDTAEEIELFNDDKE